MCISFYQLFHHRFHFNKCLHIKTDVEKTMRCHCLRLTQSSVREREKREKRGKCGKCL